MVHFTIRFPKTFNTILTAVLLLLTLAAGVTYISGSINVPGGNCSESSGTVTCTLSNLTAAAVATFETTAPASEGSITNMASVSADQIDTVIGNNDDTEDTEVSLTADGGTFGGGSIDPLLLIIPGVLLLILLIQFRIEALIRK